MSHTIQQIGGYLSSLWTMTIQNYTLGGEPVTAAEFLADNVKAVFFTPCTSNSLGSILIPVLVGSNIRLFQSSGGSISEIPTTAALNAILTAEIFFFAR
jgi:hypothetical protein